MTGPRIIIALDFPTAKQALDFSGRLTPSQCRVKVGLELFTAAGPSLVRTLVDRGFDVFLDLKFHDIPTTVARAVRQASELGVWMLNVHGLGGVAMLAAARAAIDSASHRPLLIGVTVLTSHDANELAAVGLQPDTTGEATRLAKLIHAQGLDGVVCSGHETASLRRTFGQDFLLVTPGIRPSGTAVNDQQRAMTPADAIAAGADYLVLGRPITRAQDPANALEDISRQIGETVQ